jgi:hypothetical protein
LSCEPGRPYGGRLYASFTIALDGRDCQRRSFCRVLPLEGLRCPFDQFRSENGRFDEYRSRAGFVERRIKIRTNLETFQLSTKSSTIRFRRISPSLIGSLHVGHSFTLACIASLTHYGVSYIRMTQNDSVTDSTYSRTKRMTTGDDDGSFKGLFADRAREVSVVLVQ